MKTTLFLATSILAFGCMSVSAANAAAIITDSTNLKEEYEDVEQREFVPFEALDAAGAASLAGSASSSAGFTIRGFEGISQYNVASFGRNFVPPDTMGAVGTTQYTSFVNGGFGVFTKSTGATEKLTSDVAFWNAAGQSSANGDSRVMFNSSFGRWIAISFASAVSNIQIAISDTANAAGHWASTVFQGYIPGGTADYPTLAMDTNAVYIGTNNFNAAGNFRGTTLNEIPISSLFNGLAPTTLGMKQFVTPYDPVTGGSDGGFAIQGVNSDALSTTGHIEAVSLFTTNTLVYDVLNAGTATATKANAQYVDGTADYDGNGPGRQPNAVADTGSTANFANNNRVVDTLDDRIGSSVYEVNGRIYSVHTVTPSGTDFTVVRYSVIDANTKQLLDEGDIGDPTHDYYEGSLAVNKDGQVVIAYNRSGSSVSDGNISILTRAFNTGADGKLTQQGDEQLLKTSLVDDYHNGSVDGQIALGRQRWGDYSSVSLDPTDSQSFWVIGEFAREYNNAAGGHPGGTGGSRWSTWISQVSIAGVSGSVSAVPEPNSWVMLIFGFGLAGAALRRRPRVNVSYA